MKSVSPQEEDEKSFLARSPNNDAAGPLDKHEFTTSASGEVGMAGSKNGPKIRLLEIGFFVPADISQIDSTIQHILSESRQMGGLQGDVSALEAALREALRNAVLHGCRGDSDKSVEVVMDFDDSTGVSIMVRDPGEGFDSGQFLTAGSTPGTRSKGRGINRILQNMDRVQFKAHGAEIHMFKRLS